MKHILIIFLLSSFSIAYSQIDDDPVEVPFGGCQSFYLLPGEKYIVSAWVKETHSSAVKSYVNSGVQISYTNGRSIGATFSERVFKSSGKIIDGWQRIINVFTVPLTIGTDDETPHSVLIDLVNNHTNDVYFDDIRIFPYNGTMKSFVYDEDTQRLMAELDENNYATYYEYDAEGGLVRVKKETEEGIYTIQETRSSTIKTTN